MFKITDFVPYMYIYILIHLSTAYEYNSDSDKCIKIDPFTLWTVLVFH